MITTGFFGHRSNNESKKTLSDYIDVGGMGDCGFRSIAAAFVSKLLTTDARAYEEILNRFLKKHFEFFPQQEPEGRLLRPLERLKLMVKNSVDMAKFVSTFAYTLRQMAVDEILTHPEQFRGAIVKNQEVMPVSAQAMREPGTWIDETAIAAIANLGLPISVRVVEKGKVLPMQLHYQANSTNRKTFATPIEIQLQAGHYIPKVADTSLFDKVKSVSTTSIKPAAHTSTDPELSEILNRIQEADEMLLADFKRTKKRLVIGVQTGEINKEQLLDIYIKGMKSSDYLQGRIKYVGVEHGNQNFFNAIEDKKHGLSIVKTDSKPEEDEVTMELIRAIARATSIGQMDAAQVFSTIEQVQQLQSTSSFKV